MLDLCDNLYCQYLCIGAHYQYVKFYVYSFKLVTIKLLKITNATNLAHLLVKERIVIPLMNIHTYIIWTKTNI